MVIAMNDSLPNILIVDDRPENLISLATVLEADDRNIITAGSGSEALKKLLKTPVALVLLDVQMPGMDGFEVAELMSSRKETQSIPIIFLTAISKENKYINRGYKAGAVDYLCKPVNPEVLDHKVSFFIKLYLQRQELELKLSQAKSHLEAYQREKLNAPVN